MKLLWLTDVVGAPLTLVPVLAAYGPLLLACAWADWRLALASPFLGLLFFLLAVRSLRALLPKLTPGVARMGLNRRLVSWYAHLALGRAVKVALLWPLFQRVPVLARTYLRVMGAQVGRGVHFGRGVELVDLPLVRIGDGVVLGEHAVVLAHNFAGDRLLLVAVELGARVQVGDESQVAVGARVGEGTRIGKRCLLAMRKFEAGSEIADGSYLV